MPSALEEACLWIGSMRVRGATAIGVFAAEALADHVASIDGDLDAVRGAAEAGAKRLLLTRPTAVTLEFALDRVRAAVATAPSVVAAKEAAHAAAGGLGDAFVAAHRSVAGHAAALLSARAVVLTHCHSTAVVATVGEAVRVGKRVDVTCTETRPWGQGRITAGALRAAGAEVTFVVDGAMQAVLDARRPDLVLVGADAVAADGSLFNKVGTAGLAALCEAAKVPFVCVAASFKFTRRAWQEVPIEERGADEVLPKGEVPEGVRVWNPVFDRTPPERITAYVTEAGRLSPEDAVAWAAKQREVLV